MTEREFETTFGRRLGLRDPDGLIDSMFAGMRPEPRMVEAVRELRRGGILTGLVSNSWSTEHYDRILLAELFDVSVISAEVGMHKPQPEIYRLAAERLEVEPAQCIFVDDLRENCEGAEAVGMTAIRHRNPIETIGKLTELTGVALEAAA
jgi:putative hydrolase of the HAD superfamily